jgi:hypothetical protein
VKGTVGTGPFQTISVRIAEGTFGNLGVEPGDYDAIPASSRVLVWTLPFPGAQVVGLDPTEFPWINHVGRTEFRLQFNGEWDGDGTADQVQWYAGERNAHQCAQSGEGDGPRLGIRYTAE